MVAEKVIEPTPTEWVVPIVFATKRSDSLHFWVKYRKLKTVTERNFLPFPRMGECIVCFGESIVFSTLKAK